MNKIFLGFQSYTARDIGVTGQRLVNMYAEPNPEGSKYPYTLYNTAGLVEFADLGTVKSIDGMQVMGGVLYAVSGNSVKKVTSTGTVSALGTITGTEGRVSLSNNGTQMMIINPDGDGFVATTSAVAAISDGDFPTATMGCFLDGYSIVSVANSGQFNISTLYNSTAWDALDFATAEETPDNLILPFPFNSALWLFGESSYEVYYNSGNADFPFEQNSGGVNTTRGIGAKFSAAQDDNSFLFLGNDRIVYRAADGYSTVRVSTHAIEQKFNDYATISDAFAFIYNQDGHKFYVLTFPSEGETWCLDLATGLWHERVTIVSGLEYRWRANCYVEFAGKQLVGDYINGKIYALSPTTYSDAGETVRRVIRGSTQWAESNRFITDTLHLDIDTGVGLTTGQGSDPQVMMRFSDDGGKTWSNEAWRGFGRIGEYFVRPVWRRLGIARERIYEFVVSDPVPVRISGAYVEGRVGR